MHGLQAKVDSDKEITIKPQMNRTHFVKTKRQNIVQYCTAVIILCATSDRIPGRDFALLISNMESGIFSMHRPWMCGSSRLLVKFVGVNSLTGS